MKHKGQGDTKQPGRWLSPGLICQTRATGTMVWQETVNETPVQVPENATADRLGRVTFRVGDIEYRVNDRQIRVGGYGAAGQKPIAKPLPGPTPIEELPPIASRIAGAGSMLSGRMKAHRLAKKWKEKQLAADSAPVESSPPTEQVESLEPNTMHTRRVPLLKTKRKIAFKESLPPKEG
jgi:hypothetical protein